MERTKGKHLVLILARELAANVATPMVIVDHDLVVVFFNEPAEVLLGETFAATGEISVVAWGRKHRPLRVDGSDYPLNDFPLTTALVDHRPAQDVVRFTAGDGAERTVSVAAYPLLSRSNEFAGAVGIFWQRGD